jgi:hypothetical protein
MIEVISSSVSSFKRIVSSMRLRNYGRNDLRSSAITLSRTAMNIGLINNRSHECARLAMADAGSCRGF